MQPSPQVPYRVRLTMWLALTLSIGMYFVVIKMTPPSEAQPNPTLAMVLLLCSAGLVAASMPLKTRFLSRANPPTSRMRQQAELVAFMFCEAAALLGVVVWFVTAWPHYYAFLLLGLLGMLLHFPPREA